MFVDIFTRCSNTIIIYCTFNLTLFRINLVYNCLTIQLRSFFFSFVLFIYKFFWGLDFAVVEFFYLYQNLIYCFRVLTFQKPNKNNLKQTNKGTKIPQKPNKKHNKNNVSLYAKGKFYIVTRLSIEIVLYVFFSIPLTSFHLHPARVKHQQQKC